MSIKEDAPADNTALGSSGGGGAVIAADPEAWS